MKTTATGIVIFFMMCAIPTVVYAGVHEDWDTVSLGVNGWEGVVGTGVQHESSGGNPGGYLEVEGTGTLVIATGRAEFTGDYAAQGYNQITFDVKPLLHQLNFEPEIVLRAGSSGNNWRYKVTDYANVSTWQTLTVPFDPLWSDTEAEAHGWESEGPNSMYTFQYTVSHMWKLMIRFPFGMGIGQSMAVDNVVLRKYTNVKESLAQGAAHVTKPSIQTKIPIRLKPGMRRK